MPRIDADRTGAEPIVVVLNGKDYTVVRLTSAVMQKVQELTKEPTMDTPVKQLAILLGIPPEELADVDLLKIGTAIQGITKAAHEAIDGGNPTGAAAK